MNVVYAIISVNIIVILTIQYVSGKTNCSTTLRQESERTDCVYGFGNCLHGYCDRTRQLCVCDDCWAGFYCTDMICPEECPKNCKISQNVIVCPPVETTTQDSPSLEMTNVTIETTTTQRIKNTTTNATIETTAIEDITSNHSTNGTWPPGHVCSQTYVQTVTYCNGFFCYNGNCVQLSETSYGCKCKPGATGAFCENRCCKLCEVGDCSMVNNREFCNAAETNTRESIKNTITNATNETNAIEDTTSNHSTNGTWPPGHVCSQTYVQTVTYCNGFFCYNGKCVQLSKTSYRCECKPGATGAFCENRCCKLCEIGECSIVNNREFCNAAETNTTERIKNTITNATNETNAIEDTTSNHSTNGTWPPGHVCSQTYVQTVTYCNGFFCYSGKCVQLSETSYRCKCEPGATGAFCENRCCKLCEIGECSIVNNREFCNPVMTDPLPFIQTKETWYWWVVGFGLGLIVLLILLLVVLPYWMWRNRVILIMKIVHYFQRYEDGDDREWDAFISYKCNCEDEEFVLKYLRPKLEEELGFKLCLYDRDFVPGDSISNNIIRAVTSSRRTILILTPRFTQSGFTEFEYEEAQYELLHKRIRIIPILLEDISEVKHNFDKSLQHLIKSVTYLKWPGYDDTSKHDKFWSRLILSMPKRRLVEKRRKEISTVKSNISGNYVTNITDEKYSYTSKCGHNILVKSEIPKDINGITTLSYSQITTL